MSALSLDCELDLLREVLTKCRVRNAVVFPSAQLSEVLDTTFYDIFGHSIENSNTVFEFFGAVESNTLYRYTDAFGLSYLYFALPIRADAGNILFIGPYLPSSLSQRELFELGERLGVSPKAQRYIEEYFSGVPVIKENDSLFVLVHTFCERASGERGFTLRDYDPQGNVPEINISDIGENADDVLLGMKTMERRYEFENEMLEAVAKGNLNKEAVFANSYSDSMFEKRLADPVRNIKNYSIIMNTLLRKAAEHGGVHPLYLDRLSSDFAKRIEQTATLEAGRQLMREMFVSYCKLVRKHRLRGYSPLVQKTILIVESDLSADLSLSVLAGRQGVSGSYLSTEFKRETGKTLSEYIRDKRLAHACRLLSTTHLQVQTVALHCGIMDVQYFSKLFKKHTGKTPKEYRESAKNKR